MKTEIINEDMVLIKSYWVPSGKRFRVNKTWWEKEKGARARMIINSSEQRIITEFTGEVVAMFKKDLPDMHRGWILKTIYASQL